MTIIDMLNIWAELSVPVSKATKVLEAPHESHAFESGGDGWGQAFDEWEEKNNKNIKQSLDILIYGSGKDKGILDHIEQIAIEHHHLSAVFKSVRTSIGEDYARAINKLKPKMIGRGFLVE